MIAFLTSCVGSNARLPSADTPKTLKVNQIGAYALPSRFMSRMAATGAAVVTGNANPNTALAGI